MAKRKKLGCAKNSPYNVKHHLIADELLITIAREKGGKIRIIAPPHVVIKTVEEEIPLDKPPESSSIS